MSSGSGADGEKKNIGTVSWRELSRIRKTCKVRHSKSATHNGTYIKLCQDEKWKGHNKNLAWNTPLFTSMPFVPKSKKKEGEDGENKDDDKSKPTAEQPTIEKATSNIPATAVIGSGASAQPETTKKEVLMKFTIRAEWDMENPEHSQYVDTIRAMESEWADLMVTPEIKNDINHTFIRGKDLVWEISSMCYQKADTYTVKMTDSDGNEEEVTKKRYPKFVEDEEGNKKSARITSLFHCVEETGKVPKKTEVYFLNRTPNGEIKPESIPLAEAKEIFLTNEVRCSIAKVSAPTLYSSKVDDFSTSFDTNIVFIHEIVGPASLQSYDGSEYAKTIATSMNVQVPTSEVSSKTRSHLEEVRRRMNEERQKLMNDANTVAPAPAAENTRKREDPPAPTVENDSADFESALAEHEISGAENTKKETSVNPDLIRQNYKKNRQA